MVEIPLEDKERHGYRMWKHIVGLEIDREDVRVWKKWNGEKSYKEEVQGTRKIDYKPIIYREEYI